MCIGCFAPRRQPYRRPRLRCTSTLMPHNHSSNPSLALQCCRWELFRQVSIFTCMAKRGVAPIQHACSMTGDCSLRPISLSPHSHRMRTTRRSFLAALSSVLTLRFRRSTWVVSSMSHAGTCTATPKLAPRGCGILASFLRRMSLQRLRNHSAVRRLRARCVSWRLARASRCKTAPTQETQTPLPRATRGAQSVPPWTPPWTRYRTGCRLRKWTSDTAVVAPSRASCFRKPFPVGTVTTHVRERARSTLQTFHWYAYACAPLRLPVQHMLHDLICRTPFVAFCDKSTKCSTIWSKSPSILLLILCTQCTVH